MAALERAGVVTGVITQNVDLLHTKAGSRNVINLHGTYAQVICLSCGYTMTRAALAEQLEALNPGFIERAEAVGGLAVAPDADAVVADTASFRYLDCPPCGGMLKPDIVYFGESVPKDVVEQAYSLVDEAEALLVAGSSLTVFSGYRFVRHAAAQRHPDRHRQPRPHPRRRPGRCQGRRRLLGNADAAGQRANGGTAAGSPALSPTTTRSSACMAGRRNSPGKSDVDRPIMPASSAAS